MFINLIKLFQSAAETSNFQTSMQMKQFSMEKSPVSLFHITTEHLSTLLHISGTDLQLRTTDEAVTSLQHYKFKGSSLNIVPLLLLT